MAGESGRFGRADRLRKSREFRRVSTEGRRKAGSLFVLLSSPRESEALRSSVTGRLGVTVSRKVGNAVTRNLVKRRLRAWFRSARVRLPQDRDWVVIARSAARKASFQAMVRELDQLTGALGGSHG